MRLSSHSIFKTLIFFAMQMTILSSQAATPKIPRVERPRPQEIQKRKSLIGDKKAFIKQTISSGPYVDFFFPDEKLVTVDIAGIATPVKIAAGTRFYELPQDVQSAILAQSTDRDLAHLNLSHKVNLNWFGGMAQQIAVRTYSFFKTFIPDLAAKYDDAFQPEDAIVQTLQALTFNAATEEKKNELLKEYQIDKKSEFLIRAIWSIHCSAKNGLLVQADCQAMMGDVTKYLYPFNIQRFTAIPSHIEVSFNEQYFRPVQRATIRAVRLLQDFRKGKPDYSLNLFDLLKEEFIRDGYSAPIATDYAFEIMAIYGSRGPNIYSVYENGTILSLQILASVANVLDLHYDQNGKSFLLPATIRFPIEIGKAYHFWLPAVVAYRMEKQHHSPTAARNAAVVPAIFYQMEKTSNGRDNCEYLFDDSWSSVNLKRRFDLTLAFAGAEYGARVASQKSNQIDLEKIFDELTLQAGVFPGIPETEATGTWHQRFCYVSWSEKPKPYYTAVKENLFYEIYGIRELYQFLGKIR